MIKHLHVPQGAAVYLGVPARPMPRERADAIARTVAMQPGVLEAHLPQCFVRNTMKVPGQVLVLVGETEALRYSLDDVAGSLSSVLPPGEHLDLWTLTLGDELLAAVRRANCQIFQRQDAGLT